MSRSTHIQREWLVEDLDQIRRYFPGAKFIKPLDTPFDIRSYPKIIAKPAHSAGTSEKRAEECGLPASEATRAPEERRASLEKSGALVACIGVLL